MSKATPKKTLTKAEEQVMQALWQAGQGFLKDIVDQMAPTQPHSNTVATLLKILIEKGYVAVETLGRNNLYRPLVSRDAYSRQSLGTVVSNYFEGSYTNAVSFLVQQKQLSVQDLELLLKQLKNND